MSSQKSIKVNAVLNAVKTLLGIVFPFITYPYLARVIGAELMGKTAYGNSIVAYFQLFATFGLTTYAIRELSAIRDDREKSSRMTSEFLSLSLFLSLLSYIGLCMFVFLIPQMRPYRSVILIQGVTILFASIGMEWMNTVYEDYLYITIRTLVMQTAFLVLLFFLVKSKADFMTSIILTTASSGGICVANFIHMRRYQKPFLIFSKKIFSHMRYMSVFFINAVAIQIYVNADTTMLGWMKGDYHVGIYGAATKVYTATTLLVTSIYNVTIPRLSYYYGKVDKQRYFELLTKVISAVVLFLLPVVAGMFVFADLIIFILAGKEFEPAVRTLQILSFAMAFAVIGGIVTQCLNVTAKREKHTAFATVITALENILLNLYFIRMFAQNGAAVTTLIAQATVFLYCAYKSRDLLKLLNWKNILRNASYAMLGIVIVAGIRYMTLILHFSEIKNLLTVPLCVIIYAIFLIAFKNPLAVEMFQKIRRKLWKQK